MSRPFEILAHDSGGAGLLMTGGYSPLRFFIRFWFLLRHAAQLPANAPDPFLIGNQIQKRVDRQARESLLLFLAHSPETELLSSPCFSTFFP